MEEVLNESRGAPSGEPSTGMSDPVESSITGDIAALTAERDQAVAQKEEIWDRFLRKQAEFENFRKRTTREKEEVLHFAAMEIARSLVPVLDDFERALKTPAEGADYRKGIELIYKRLYDTLVKDGLTPIESLGKKFDPHLHQAVDTVKGGEDQTIVEEYQRGYEFKGRLLRPAMVKVSVRE